MSVRVLQVPYEDGRAQDLVAEVQQEYVVRYGGVGDGPLDPAAFEPPRGRFFVVTRDDRPVAMGGWRPGPALDDLGATRVAEVKRMFVATDAPRTGLARLVLRTLEDSAREAGYDLLA